MTSFSQKTPTLSLFSTTSIRDNQNSSVFWVRRLAALGGEQATIEHWQIKRNGDLRGIIEIIPEAE
jgi:hypothetical protein